MKFSLPRFPTRPLVRLGLAAILFSVVVSPARASTAASVDELWRRGQSAQHAGRWDEAIAAYDALLKAQPQHVNALVASGYAHWKKGDLDAAEQRYRQAIVINKFHVGAGYGLGQIAISRKQWNEAATLFQKVLSLAPQAEPVRARHNLAIALHALERYDEAATVLHEALSQPAENLYPELFRLAADAEIARRDYERAATLSEAGAQRFPNDALLWNRLGWALQMRRERERAQAAFRQAEKLAYADATPRHRTVLSLPFRGAWRVLQGNDADPTHRGLSARFAWDFVAVNQNGPARPDGTPRNGDFYTFGQEVLAPADGRVVALENNSPDNEPFHRSASPQSGNYVLLEHAPGEFSLLAHLQKGSLAVKVGEAVKRGQLLARCGNSGYTALPHLHFTFMTMYGNTRISAPAHFSKYFLLNEGKRTLVESGAPTQHSIVENAQP